MESERKVEFNYEYMEEGVNINHYFVEIDHRREGHGRETLDKLVQKFKREGYDYVVINMKGGETAKQFLESCEFTVVEKSGKHVTAEKEL